MKITKITLFSNKSKVILVAFIKVPNPGHSMMIKVSAGALPIDTIAD